MPTYLHPGVYVEEVPSGARPIEAVSTSTAVFLGYATRGPIGSPELLFTFDDYIARYGGLRDRGAEEEGDALGFALRAFFLNGGSKAYVVRLAQDDGPTDPLEEARGVAAHPDLAGQRVEIVAINEGTWADGLVARFEPKGGGSDLFNVAVGRYGDRGQLVAQESFRDVSLAAAHPRFLEAVLGTDSNLVTGSVRLNAQAPVPDGYTDLYGFGHSTSGDLAGAALDFSGIGGAAGRTVSIAVDGDPPIDVVLPQQDFDGDLAAVAGLIQEGVVAGGAAGFTAVAEGDLLVLTSGTTGAGSTVVVSNSGLASTLNLGGANGGTERTGLQAVTDVVGDTSGSFDVVLSDGGDGVAPEQGDYDAALTLLEKVRDISIVALPGIAWDPDDAAQQGILQSAISHVEATANRMLLVDPPVDTELVTEQEVNDLGLPTSTYTALYYPWAEVPNPFFHAENNPSVPVNLKVPPSGYAAGMWAKTDARRGVWKAPAGVETQLLGLSGLEFQVEEQEQDQLNPLGVNALRTLPGFGRVIWGSRTLATRATPEWRYVPVRRTALFIETSLYNGIQWAVFEPNDHNLWASLRANIGAFMNGLFRSGAFQGEKASDAYFVRCGLGDTMTQGDIDRGQAIVVVGFAPLKPAEFVIVRIQQIVGQS
ncbi:MAG: phage tail sheath subtilisin-like domain-containing protein [Acidobacteriota bacterium]